MEKFKTGGAGTSIIKTFFVLACFCAANLGVAADLTLRFGAMNGPIFQEMYENLAKQAGLRIFAVAGARSPRAIVTTKEPIKTPADLKGMRLRIPPIDMFRAMFERVGVIHQ